MSISKAFGARITDRVRVRIQNMVNGRVQETQSFSVAGFPVEQVKDVVEEALGRKFGEADADIHTEGTEQQTPRTKGAKIKLRKKVR